MATRGSRKLSKKRKVMWFKSFTLEEINQSRSNTMVTHLGIEVIEIGKNFLKAKMPVDERTKQPHGIMHGGASCALAETVASVAANCCVDEEKFYCVGVEINTSHVKSVSSGFVVGIAKALHLGKTTQLWEIEIFNEQEALVSISRLRLAVLNK